MEMKYFLCLFSTVFILFLILAKIGFNHPSCGRKMKSKNFFTAGKALIGEFPWQVLYISTLEILSLRKKMIK